MHMLRDKLVAIPRLPCLVLNGGFGFVVGGCTDGLDVVLPSHT